MSQNIVVQKFGGTSVGSVERIRQVAKRVAATRAEGKKVLVVVSAMAGETDRLLNLAHEMSENPERREIDLLLSSGERISAALLAIALRDIGCPAISVTGRQMGLLTDNSHTRARIIEIDGERVRKFLKDDQVVVCAGFQGINEQGDVTTLGRGGSDTSAVALAVALNSDVCEIYTDVKGVYTTDPRIVPEARKLDMVSFEEMLEMASLGAKVLQIRCVEYANKYKMPIKVRSTFEDDPGTLICEENPDMEQPVVSGVMCAKDQSKITLKGVPDQPGIAAKVFCPLSEQGVSVDVIIQNVSQEGHTDISFTLPKTHLKEAMEVMERSGKEIQAAEVKADSHIAKISIVGAGMRSHAGIAARMFDSLSREGINIMMISTSEIRISCILEEKYAELAVRVLHDEFKLGENSSEKAPQAAESDKKAM